MAITKRVQRELEQATPSMADATRKPRPSRRRRQEKSSPVQLTKAQREAVAEKNKGKTWSAAEHQRFLEALDRFPSGPWKAIADYVGTKNSRQTMTHAQKYREKHERHSRGLRTKSKKKKNTKKISSTKVPMRRTPRRQVRSAHYVQEVSTEQESDEEDEEESCASDTERIEADTDDLDQDIQNTHEEKDFVKAESLPDTFDSEDMNDDDFLSAFGETCADETSCMPTASSPPCISSLTIPDALIFASVDLWQSQSLAEMELGVDDGGSTDLDDSSDFAMALSQECW